MGGRNLTLSLWTISVMISAASSVAVNGSSQCEQQLAACTREFEGFQTKTLVALKEISDGNQLCAPPTGLENHLKQKHREVQARQKKDLITGNLVKRHT